MPGLVLKQQLVGHAKSPRNIYFDELRKNVVSVSHDSMIVWDQEMVTLSLSSHSRHLSYFEKIQIDIKKRSKEMEE